MSETRSRNLKAEEDMSRGKLTLADLFHLLVVLHDVSQCVVVVISGAGGGGARVSLVLERGTISSDQLWSLLRLLVSSVHPEVSRACEWEEASGGNERVVQKWLHINRITTRLLPPKMPAPGSIRIFKCALTQLVFRSSLKLTYITAHLTRSLTDRPEHRNSPVCAQNCIT